jgi:hypothetical protein
MDFIFCNNCGLRTNQAVELCSHCHKPHTNSKDKPPGSSIYRPSVDEAPSVEELGAKNAGISKLRQDILQKENIGQSKLARLKTLCTRKFPKPGHGYGNKEQPKARLTLKSLPALTRSVEAPPLTPAPTRPIEVNQAEEKPNGSPPAEDKSGCLLVFIVCGIGFILLLIFGASSTSQDQEPPKKSYLEELRKIDDPDKADQYARDNMRALLEEGYENYRRSQEKQGK